MQLLCTVPGPVRHWLVKLIRFIDIRFRRGGASSSVAALSVGLHRGGRRGGGRSKRQATQRHYVIVDQFAPQWNYEWPRYMYVGRRNKIAQRNATTTKSGRSYVGRPLRLFGSQSVLNSADWSFADHCGRVVGPFRMAEQTKL